MLEGPWSGFRIVETPPREPGDDDSPLEATGRYVELAETGWDALIAWVLGPEHVVRVRALVPLPPVRVTKVLADGTRRSWEIERTRTDQADIERDIDQYLEEAGIPHQPFGYMWFLRIPDNYEDQEDFWEVVHAAVGQATDPPAVCNALTRALPRLLGNSGAGN